MKNYRNFKEEYEWLRARDNFFTASEINRLMAEPTKKAKEAGQILSDGAMTYIIEKISAKLDNPKDYYTNFEMDWGKTQEPEAALKLCEMLELEPKSNDAVYVGNNEYILFDDGIIAGTPDMIFVTRKAIAEIKCPNSQTHLKNKLFISNFNFQSEYPIYYDQIQTNLYLTESDFCYFFSYDPRFKKEHLRTHMIKIERNQDRIDAIIAKSMVAFDYKNQLIEQLEKTI